jgi:hypothetical protein
VDCSSGLIVVVSHILKKAPKRKWWLCVSSPDAVFVKIICFDVYFRVRARWWQYGYPSKKNLSVCNAFIDLN